MSELIERLEKAAEPSRELDEEIMAMLYKRENRHIGTREGWDDERFDDCIPVKDAVWVDPATDKWVSTHAKRFTSSLDDAMTLLPLMDDGETHADFILECTNGGLTIGAMVGHDNRDKCSWGATPALAICAAALRARQEYSDNQRLTPNLESLIS